MNNFQNQFTIFEKNKEKERKRDENLAKIYTEMLSRLCRIEKNLEKLIEKIEEK